MKPILLPTAYLPPLSWMALAFHSGSVGIEIHETYPKQTFRNRCNIASSSGILSLTVPVIRTYGNHTTTGLIGIDNSVNWQQLHWRSMVTAYNKSPYFLYYRDLFEPIYTKKHELLIDLNRELLSILLKVLQIRNKEILFTDSYDFKPDAADLRNSFKPGNRADQSITQGLPRYMQTFEVNHGYIPDLSIVDLLFNLGPDALPYLANVKFMVPEMLNVQQDIRS